MSPPRALIILVVFLGPFACLALGQGATESKGTGEVKENGLSRAIQIDVKEVLNARVVTVVKNGALVPMHDDIDGAGGLATKAASDLMGDKNAHPLPDDATFSSADRRPLAVLNYGNEDATQNQARRSIGQDTFDFPVPPDQYAHLYLFLTSGWGASKIAVKLVYADHTVERRDLEVPDWFWELKPDDAYRSYLTLNLGKWSKDNRMIEDNHHAIFSLDVTPSPEKMLTKVYVQKQPSGLMVFYGATGVVAGGAQH